MQVNSQFTCLPDDEQKNNINMYCYKMGKFASSYFYLNGLHVGVVVLSRCKMLAKCCEINIF